MNWDEEAKAEDIRRIEDRTGKFPCLVKDLFKDGAKWQREQLRTDEALEPWARAIYLEANARNPWAPNWEAADEFARGAAFSRARGMINALLGED